MTPRNFLFILSDEHRRDAAGCYGHPLARTPNLDRLAREGVRFDRAYTPCPICVPARAALHTGRWVHQTGSWDNAFPYRGDIVSWAHRVRESGLVVESIGKLHFRSPDEDHGFTREHDPLHVVGGIGDLMSALRDDPPRRSKRGGLEEAGPGESTYLEYDRRIEMQARAWIRSHAGDTAPWVLFVSFVCPHPPYIAPQEFCDLYPLDRIPLPPEWDSAAQPDHPALDFMRDRFGYGPMNEALIRQVTQAYLGAVTYLDQRIGCILQELEATGLCDSTHVLYASDHGENLGARGLFGKFTMYEESAGIPMLLRSPDAPRGAACSKPSSLVDVYPTILKAVGVTPSDADRGLPGVSLFELASGAAPSRGILSEYHAVNSRRGIFLLANGRYKYVHYVEGPPQIFDLQTDPNECRNLAEDHRHQTLRRNLERQLRSIVDPEAVDRKARSEQAALVESFGGEGSVRSRGTFDNSPIPGEAPQFSKTS